MRIPSASGREYKLLLALCLFVCAILPLGWAVKVAITPETLYPDFFGLWSFGRYVLTHAPATVYDDRALYTFQAGMGMPADKIYSFYYPPWILLLLAPFGALPYTVAHCAWLVITFVAYVAALTAWRWQRLIIGLLVLAPSTAVCLLVGQNGFLTAALMFGGTRLLHTRPLLAGALLGGLGYKPQLAILVPVTLLFGRHWRAMIGAVLSGAALSLATTSAFGLGIWDAWLVSIHDHAAVLVGAGERDVLLDMMPSVTSAVRLLGGDMPITYLAQICGALIGLLAVWQVRAHNDARSRAVLPLATIISTPYAFDYDLPMVTGAVLALIAARLTAAEPFGPMEFLLLLGCIVVQTILPGHLGAMLATVPMVFALTLLVICREAGTDSLTQSAGDRPPRAALPS